jgi:hypothetical protein
MKFYNKYKKLIILNIGAEPTEVSLIYRYERGLNVREIVIECPFLPLTWKFVGSAVAQAV